MGIQVQRHTENAGIPIRGSKSSAGYDLYTSEDTRISANSRILLKIGLAIAVPEGTYDHIVPRSGLATKGILVDAGVIDADYRGEIKILLVNHGIEHFEVRKGDCIAQLIVDQLDHRD